MSYISRDKKNLYKKCLLIIIFIGILCLSVRLYKIKLINDKYKSGMLYDDNVKLAKYYSVENGYIFRYAKASLFSMDCFMSVSTEEDAKLYIGDDGQIYSKDMQIILYIWPISNKYGLYFFMNNGEENIDAKVYIDKNMKCISENEEYAETMNKLIDKYIEDIEKLLQEADRKWDLK